MKFNLLVLLIPLAMVAKSAGEPPQDVVDMLPGIVEAFESIDLTAPQLGLIASVEVEEMQTVEAQQLLVRLDSRLAEASLAAALAVSERTAAHRRADLNVSLAEKYLKRVRFAFDKSAASGLELDEAEGRLEEARVALAQVREEQREAAAQVEVERERIHSLELRAPFPGTVMRVTAKSGATANPNTPLLRLTNLRLLRVSLHVPVQYFAHLQVGETYTLAAAAPAPPTVNAKLVAQEPVVDAATGTFRCVFEFDNSDLSLPAGFAVRLCEPSPSS